MNAYSGHFNSFPQPLAARNRCAGWRGGVQVEGVEGAGGVATKTGRRRKMLDTIAGSRNRKKIEIEKKDFVCSCWSVGVTLVDGELTDLLKTHCDIRNIVAG